MKYDVSLNYLQESASGLSLQPQESRLQLSILYSFTIHFTIILQSTCISSKGFFPQVIELINLPPHTCHMLRQTYYPNFISGQ